MKQERIGKAPLLLMACIASASLSTACPDFFGNGNLKDQIENDVDEAIAPTQPVEIRPADTAMGIPTPFGSVNFKVAKPVELTTSVNDSYGFVSWTHNGLPGDIVFSAPTSTNTTATLKVNKPGLRITPMFDARPRVMSKRPQYDNVPINQGIYINFSEDVDPASIELGRTIFVRAMNAYEEDPPVEDWSTWFDCEVSGKTVKLSLKLGKVMLKYFVVEVAIMAGSDLEPGLVDEAGIRLKEDYLWDFTTGNSEDSTPPAINELTIQNEFGETLNGSTAWVRTNQIRIITSATDASPIISMRIIETPLNGDGTEAGPAVTRDPIPYSSSQSFTMDSLTHGFSRKIQVELCDSFGQWSEAIDSATDMRVIMLDNLVPTIPGFSLSGGAAYTRSQAPSVSATGLDGTFAPITGYTLTSKPTTATVDIATDGAKTVYLHARDSLGNAAYTLASIYVDTSAPSGAALSLNAGASAPTDLGAGSQANGILYALSESSAKPSAGWSTSVPTAYAMATGSDGTRRVYLHVKDSVGNWASAYDEIDLDRSKPTLSSVTLAAGDSHTKDSVVAFVAEDVNDIGSGLGAYAILFASGSPAPSD